mmetsp:Transcript_94611/g.246420  ORF Transcript_94611/g.246420 Transcript_94611/m.246420 type:complete len:400 (-) Transcript_94611:776-1975(-)
MAPAQEWPGSSRPLVLFLLFLLARGRGRARGTLAPSLPGPRPGLFLLLLLLLLQLERHGGHLRGLLQDLGDLVGLTRDQRQSLRLVQGRRRWRLLRLFAQQLGRQVAGPLQRLARLERYEVDAVPAARAARAHGGGRILQVARHGLQRRAERGRNRLGVLTGADGPGSASPAVPVLDDVLQLPGRRRQVDERVLGHEHELLRDGQSHLVLLLLVVVVLVLHIADAKHVGVLDRLPLPGTLLLVDLHGVPLQGVVPAHDGAALAVEIRSGLELLEDHLRAVGQAAAALGEQVDHGQLCLDGGSQEFLATLLEDIHIKPVEVVEELGKLLLVNLAELSDGDTRLYDVEHLLRPVLRQRPLRLEAPPGAVLVLNQGGHCPIHLLQGSPDLAQVLLHGFGVLL